MGVLIADDRAERGGLRCQEGARRAPPMPWTRMGLEAGRGEAVA